MQIDINGHIAEYKSKVLSQLEDLTAIGNLIPQFKSIDFTIESFDEKALKELEIPNAVYIIQIKDFGAKLNSILICEKLNRLKKKSKKNRYPKVNMQNAKVLNNTILYIGKSSGTFSKRLGYHLDKNPYGTYAMHMRAWGKEFSELQFKLIYTSIDDSIFNQYKNIESKDLLELIETSLHHKYKPLLGRSGH